MRNVFWEKREFKWWILLLCAYHFFPFITTRGSILMYAWAYAVPLAYMAFNIKYLKKIALTIIHSEVMIMIVGILLLSCVSVTIPVLYNTGDFTYFTGAIMTTVKILFRMLFLCMIIVKYIPKATKETFMKYFIFSCCLYICGTIVMLLVPAIRDFFWEIVKESEKSKAMALEARYQTRYGWGGFSGFEYTFKCVLANIFVCYFIDKNIKSKKTILWIIVGILLFCGTLFYGRIGSLVSAVIIGLLGLKLFVKRPKILVIVIVGVIAGVIGLFIVQSRSDAVREWFVWAFDLFITFFKTGKFETYSSNVLLEEMLFVPEANTILFGDGMYTIAGGYYMSTDAGIMRPLLFGGLLFAIIRYITVYLILGLKVLNNKLCREERKMYFWILFACIVFEIKGEIIFSVLPVFIWLIVIEKYVKGNKENGKRVEFKEID